MVAHRGSSVAHPEHTLQAYEQAVTEGADSLECDVRLTRDGVLVCVHDRRIDRVSDGHGVLSTLELADLEQLDFASWKTRDSDPLVASAWEQVDYDAERSGVLTLERLVQLTLDSRGPTGHPVGLHVETKHPTRYGSLVEAALVDLLERYGLLRPPTREASRVTVMSFAVSSLRRIHQRAPLLPTVYLMKRVPVRYRDGHLPLRVASVGVDLPVLQVHPRYVQRVREQGGRVHVFTVDEPADIDLVLSLGVEVVITNEPARVREHLARR